MSDSIPGKGLPWPDSILAIRDHVGGNALAAERLLGISHNQMRRYWRGTASPTSDKTRLRLMEFGWTDAELPTEKGCVPERADMYDLPMYTFMSAPTDKKLARDRPDLAAHQARVTREWPVHVLLAKSFRGRGVSDRESDRRAAQLMECTPIEVLEAMVGRT